MMGPEYHKIQTVWLRDKATNYKTLLDNEWSKPEFYALSNCQWTFTEKVDGTNIRLHLSADSQLTIGGRTDNAQIPAPLVAAIQALELDKRHELQKLPELTLYGEGYGGKIQKAGATYGPEQRFVLFDIRIGDMWLERDNITNIAFSLGLDVVPITGYGTLQTMVNICRDGFESQWGPFQAEGLIARPAVELFNRRGERVITKLKVKDFS